MSPKYRRGISALVGAAILLTIMMMFTAFHIVILQKFVDVANHALNTISSVEESRRAIEAFNALWDYNTTHITIYIENRAPRTVLATAIAIVFQDSSYITISRVNGTLMTAYVWILYTDNTVHRSNLVLPLAIPPTTETTITIKLQTQKEPETVTIAVEASPIKAVVASKRINKEEQEINSFKLPLQIRGDQEGTTTWLGRTAIPIERKGITGRTYPITITSSPTRQQQVLITRTSRGVIGNSYTDFETYPLTGWVNRGGSWSSVGGVSGAKGNVLQGTDNNGGVGGASQYYYNTDLSAYTSLWIATKMRWVSGTGYYGIVMMNAGRNRLYTVEIHTGGTINIRSYNVESRNRWYTFRSVSIPGYSATSWYILVVDYTVTSTAVTISVRVYSSTGSLLVSTSATSTSTRRFTPAYIGVEVDGTTAYSDDFVISVRDPRYLVLQNVISGHTIEVWDDLGNLVRRVVATTGTVSADVVIDTVVGRGTDGRIYLYDSRGNLIGSYIASDSIVGGDVYSLEYIYANYTAVFSDRVILEDLVKPLSTRLYLCIYTNATVNISILFNSLGLERSTGTYFCRYYTIPATATYASNDVNIYAWSRNPFSITIESLELYVYGYYTDTIFDALVIGIGGSSTVAFCRISDLYIRNSVDMCYPFSVPGNIFSGEVSIAYDSDIYALYIVNKSGVYLWNFTSIKKVTDSCRATGIGARIELIKDDIIVLPGSRNNTICVYSTTDNVAFSRVLPEDPEGFKFYIYTSSAVYNDSIYFTCMDRYGTAWLFRYDTDPEKIEKLKPIAMSAISGLAIDSSRGEVFMVVGGLWRNTIKSQKIPCVSIYTYRIASNRIVYTPIASNGTAYPSASCCDRVETYGNYMLIVEKGTLLVIDISRIDSRKNVVVLPQAPSY